MRISQSRAFSLDTLQIRGTRNQPGGPTSLTRCSHSPYASATRATVHRSNPAQFSAGIVEGLNNKVKLTTRKSCGYRTYEAIETSLYHNLCCVREPEFTHRFW
jgi:hypothetical protein